MAVLDELKASVLATRIIASVAPPMAEQLKLPSGHNSVGLITSDCDDVTYVALDEATKAANVSVAYAASFYAGAAHASGPLSGEVIGVLSGPGPADVTAGINRCVDVIEREAAFRAANEDGSLAFFAHLLSATGSYLSEQAGIARGQSLAYLIAPPLEATFALDAALKAADVSMADYFPPPSETNFSGALLTGTQAACRAACEAFQDAVLDVAARPIE